MKIKSSKLKKIIGEEVEKVLKENLGGVPPFIDVIQDTVKDELCEHAKKVAITFCKAYEEHGHPNWPRAGSREMLASDLEQIRNADEIINHEIRNRLIDTPRVPSTEGNFINGAWNGSFTNRYRQVREDMEHDFKALMQGLLQAGFLEWACQRFEIGDPYKEENDVDSCAVLYLKNKKNWEKVPCRNAYQDQGGGAESWRQQVEVRAQEIELELNPCMAGPGLQIKKKLDCSLWEICEEYSDFIGGDGIITWMRQNEGDLGIPRGTIAKLNEEVIVTFITLITTFLTKKGAGFIYKGLAKAFLAVTLWNIFEKVICYFELKDKIDEGSQYFFRKHASRLKNEIEP